LKRSFPGLFSLPNMGLDELLSLKRLCEGEEHGLSREAMAFSFSAMLGNSRYSSRMSADFGRVCGIVRSRSAGRSRAGVFWQLGAALESDSGNPDALRVAEFILSKKGMHPFHSSSFLESMAEKSGLGSLESMERNYARGEELAKSLGAQHWSGEVRLNFAYALGTVGERVARNLFNEYGIEYFARYSKESLLELERCINPEYRKSAPIFMVASPKEDWNGVFYSSTDIRGFSGEYRFLASEMRGDAYFFESLEILLGKREGIKGATSKIRSMAIKGHGRPGSLAFGDPDEYIVTSRDERGNWSEKRKPLNGALLDSSDIPRLKKFRKYFEDGAVLILEGCSSGRGKNSIAAKVSRALPGVYVCAPSRDASPPVHYLKDENGMLTGASTDVPVNKFLNGELVEVIAPS